jgi:plastocyanin
MRPLAVTACVAAAAVLSGCELTSGGRNVVRGKQLFVQHCGACHTLARAGTTGTTGPNLDQAFQRARADGFGQSTFQGVVARQILHPNKVAQVDPQTGKTLPLMPAGLVKGAAAQDVAAYVAESAARPGKDTGRLATVGARKAQGTAQEKNGTLDIPVATAGLAYTFANAQAKTGKVTVESKNPQSIQHDIAIEGNGVNAKGARVSNGGVSKLQADLKPGTYTFYCTVPGHRQGGMVGKLTVK